MKLSSKMARCGLSPMRKFNGEAAKTVERGIKIYHLNIGQPDIRTPQAFYDALKSFNQPVLAYAPSSGMPELLDAVRGYYKRIGVELSRTQILPTSGGSEALQMTMATILDDGDELLVEHTRAILISNPGNPTGSVLTPEELKLMLDIAKEHDLILVCDEVYREFVYGGEPLMSALQFAGYEENVVVIDSVSKRFSACGARVGMVISKNKAFMSEVMKWCQCRLCSATVDQVAAAALYALDPSYFDEVRAEYKNRRDTLMRKLRELPGVVCEEPKGAFYVMAALPVDDADTFQHWLLSDFDDHGETVMFACGEPFYATPGKGKNEVRMAYTINCQDLERAGGRRRRGAICAAVGKRKEKRKPAAFSGHRKPELGNTKTGAVFRPCFFASI